jgi:hypothetical protein
MFSLEHMLAKYEQEERIRKVEARYRLEGPGGHGSKRSTSHDGRSIAKLVSSFLARF